MFFLVNTFKYIVISLPLIFRLESLSLNLLKISQLYLHSPMKVPTLISSPHDDKRAIQTSFPRFIVTGNSYSGCVRRGMQIDGHDASFFN